MKKVFFPITLVIILLINSITPVYAVELNEEKNTSRLTKIVRGIGEKMGVEWTNKSLSSTVGRIAARVGVDLIIPDWWLFGTIPDTVPYEFDPSTYQLSPDEFKAGVDAIEDVSDDFVGETIIVYGACVQSDYFGLSIPAGYSYVRDTWNSQLEEVHLYSPNAEYKSLSGASFSLSSTNGQAFTWKQYTRPYSKIGTVGGWTLSGSETSATTKTFSGANNIVLYNAKADCSVPVVPEMTPNMTNVNTTNYNYNYYNTYLINTTDDNTDPTVPINEPISFDDVEPTDKPEGSSWWAWLLEPLKAIGDFFKDVGGFLLGILVPSADSVTGIFNGISDSFKAKIPIADQLGNFFAQVENIQTNDTPVAPTFEITMPVEYGGETFPIIDFSYFDEWRVWVLNFIRFAAWFIFLKRLYNRIPKMVY